MNKCENLCSTKIMIIFILILLFIAVYLGYVYFTNKKIGNNQDQKQTEEKKIVDLKFCNSAEDCVAVGCSCRCSGCGGFDYNDVINKQYKENWYRKNGCQEPEACLTVCCPPRKIDCVNNRCVVVEGSKSS